MLIHSRQSVALQSRLASILRDDIAGITTPNACCSVMARTHETAVGGALRSTQHELFNQVHALLLNLFGRPFVSLSAKPVAAHDSIPLT